MRIGSRRSTLALTQTGLIADRLRTLGHQVEIVEIVTEGDTNRASLSQLGGTGIFATAIRNALHDGRIDLTVHSLKDLPTAPADGLTVAAIPQREDPRDVLVARDGLTLGELPVDSVVGTGAPRRAAQLAALGLGLRTRDIRGNVDSRVELVRRGVVDAVVLARAGMSRLGRLDEVTEVIDPLQVLPAPGQGALALEIRTADTQLHEALHVLDHPDTRAAVTAERAVLARLEAGCAAPLGALAEISEDLDGRLEVSLRAFVGRLDGSFELRRSMTGPLDKAERIGHDLAQQLLDDGALEAFAPSDHPPEPPPGGHLPTDANPVTDIHHQRRGA
ncbi:hydroxymethylbilane synthase [Flexivirga caeni]|uniref:Porphobilinogen deaminase n=1 Tax=Flexivirga caeni TaxID=2294115 RepID=A0A3M9MIV3_9MICO|nr:hydroxymethylbilane synthase [Flexivirga caeni]